MESELEYSLSSWDFERQFGNMFSATTSASVSDTETAVDALQQSTKSKRRLPPTAEEKLVRNRESARQSRANRKRKMLDLQMEVARLTQRNCQLEWHLADLTTRIWNITARDNLKSSLLPSE
eukprot:TRINITY_DN2017_c0_g4_i1.p1 TRINITY_DN2017_c0_g4~~TRINITY_DN2017_c0_g4_i1.p1  ORF type:complete len:122 (-),score=21.11 TRINITY_DN2017_c0_g4_i1:612-977(-)